jgi:hypothetical protein
MNRRKFCLSSLATAMSGAAVGAGCLRAGEPAAPSAAASNPSVQLYKFVYDRRYPAAQVFGAAAAHARSTAGTVAIAGDVTALWSRDLRAVWCAGDGAIAGMTTARTLLCLEQLAHDHWMRVAIRVEHLGPEGHAAVHRLSAAEPMIARISPVLAGADWAAKLPAALATCEDLYGGCVTSVIGSTRPLAPADETLVSFVIAARGGIA